MPPLQGLDAWLASDTSPFNGTHHPHGINPAAVSESYVQMNNPVTLPPNALMHFGHDVAFASGWDGGAGQSHLKTLDISRRI